MEAGTANPALVDPTDTVVTAVDTVFLGTATATITTAATAEAIPSAMRVPLVSERISMKYFIRIAIMKVRKLGFPAIFNAAPSHLTASSTKSVISM